MHTIFQDPIPGPGSLFAPDPREAEHLFRVFRLREGERVRLIDGRGNSAIASAAGSRQLCVESCFAAEPPEIELHVGFAIPKKNKLDDLLPQLPGLGVRALHPLLLDHSVATGVNQERWEQILKEGCKQSGNPYLPQLFAPEKLENLLDYAEKEQITCYFGSVTPAPELAAAGSMAEKKRLWIVGPEGGFSPEEEKCLLERGVRPLRIGKWIMRLETAAIAGLAVLSRAIPLLMLILFAAGCGQKSFSGNPLLKKADYYFSSGNAELAEKFYWRLLRQYPDSAELHRKLGTLYDELKHDSAGAVYHYNRFLEKNPDSPDAPVIRKYRERALAALRREAPECTAQISSEQIRASAEYRSLYAENQRLRTMLIRTIQSKRPAPPPEKLHRIKPGESTGSIAQLYQIPLSSLLTANGLNSSAALKPGQVLKIPERQPNSSAERITL